MKTTIEQSLQAIQSPKIRGIAEKSETAFAVLLGHKETELLELPTGEEDA